VYLRRFRGRGIDKSRVKKKVGKIDRKSDRLQGVDLCEDNIKIEFIKIDNEGGRGTLNSGTGCCG
jgi:hypothetical protein